MLLEKICKELGVEIGEKWVGSDGRNYTISKTGEIFEFDDDGFCIDYNYDEWEMIFKGELKPIWKPKEGNTYYVPDIYDSQAFYIERTWANSNRDRVMLKNNLVFKSKEEAIDCATSMIDLAKHGI